MQSEMTTNYSARRDRMMGSLVGGIIADAYGSPYEFRPRDSYSITGEMEYCTTFNLPKGSFTDDSSTMLCLAVSLTECKGFNGLDQMRRYADWRRNGYMSSAPERGCFDIGRTTSMAIGRFEFHKRLQDMGCGDGVDPAKKCFGMKGELDSGNGGLMRLAPAPIFFWRDMEEAVEYSRLSSQVTHANTECMDAAALLGFVIWKGIRGMSREDMLRNESFEDKVQCDKVKALCRGEYKTKQRKDIRTTGYVIDTLEAALWAFYHANDYKDGVMTLGRMGDDTDTVCCVFGQIGGAFWGYSSLPRSWIEDLQRRDLVMKTCIDLVKAAEISQ